MDPFILRNIVAIGSGVYWGGGLEVHGNVGLSKTS